MFLVITANATISIGGLEIEFLISCLTNVLALLGQYAVPFIYSPEPVKKQTPIYRLHE